MGDTSTQTAVSAVSPRILDINSALAGNVTVFHSWKSFSDASYYLHFGELRKRKAKKDYKYVFNLFGEINAE